MADDLRPSRSDELYFRKPASSELLNQIGLV
jgi:hypothetical protein